MYGTGKTIIGLGAMANLTGNDAKGFRRPLDNAGTVDYSGSGLLFSSNSPVATVLTNLPDGEFKVTGGGDLGHHHAADNVFGNQGTLSKSGVGETVFTSRVFGPYGVAISGEHVLSVTDVAGAEIMLFDLI